MQQELLSQSEEDTKNFAKEVLKRLKPGDVLALYGDLGSGKTVFVKGLAQALGVKEEISSPTFVILRRYETASPRIKFLNHLDLYRLEEKDLSSINFGDLIKEKNSLLVIEWAERANTLLPKDTIIVRFYHKGENARALVIINSKS